MIDREHINQLHEQTAFAAIQKLQHREIENLYFFLGQALFMVQILEDAISHTIALKRDVKDPGSVSKAKANALLEKYRKFTLGESIKLIRKENIFPDVLRDALQAFLLERNWLIHRCVPENIDNIERDFSARENLFLRINLVGATAGKLQRDVEVDLEDFSASKGIDIAKMFGDALAGLVADKR